MAAGVSTSSLLPPSPALAADSKDDLQARREANQRELNRLAAELEGTSQALVEAYLNLEAAKQELPLAEAALSKAQQDFANAQQEYTELSDALAAAESQREQVTGQLASDQEEAENARRAIGQMARSAMAFDNPASNDLMVLLGAKDIKEVADNQIVSQAFSAAREAALSTAQQSAGANKNREARLEAVTTEITDLKAKAEAALARAEAAKAAAEKAKADLDKLVASLTSLTADLEAQKATEEARQTELRARQNEMDDALRKIIEKEIAEGGGGGGGGGGPAPGGGFFGWPVASPNITSPFGYRVHPISGTTRMHTGIDFGAGCGSGIFASAAGVVVQAGWAGGYGYRTVVSHGIQNGAQMMSTYSHQPGVSVSVGQSVTKGQRIGSVGTTGSSTGCHLHFEIMRNGNYVDPAPYLR